MSTDCAAAEASDAMVASIYQLFPSRFRRGVRHVYALKVHLEQSLALPMLPDEAWEMIVAVLPRTWGLDS